MLESIVIRNFAIITHSEVNFQPGMTALTGETGAGKSILLDAIQLVLGDRADSDSVRQGKDQAEINVEFDLMHHALARDWLSHNALDSDGSCIIRRVVYANGRSKAFINGTPVTLTQLKQLGEMLVDLHGQHEHQSLQKPLIQAELLDASLENRALLEQTAENYRHWKQLEKRLRQLTEARNDMLARSDTLSRYLKEFDALNLQPGEPASIREEYQLLSHSGQIMQALNEALQILYDDEQNTVQSQLTHTQQLIQELTSIDSQFSEPLGLIDSALIQISEAVDSLRNFSDRIDLDPARQDWINERISQMQGLARRHQVDENDLIDHFQSLRDELESLHSEESSQEQLAKQVEQAKQLYLDSAYQLSGQRSVSASQLSQKITEVMQTLGMQGGSFEIAVQQEGENNCSDRGIDRVQFLVSANPGQSPKSLSKVASGGELSRISLAISVILSQSTTIPTLIFDEVDSGIGGGIAETVGRKLREVAGHRQVLCVTHLPQVAACAHHHLRVTKSQTEQHTETEVCELYQDKRVNEIARMLGGVSITEQSLAHAREMLLTTQD